MGSVTTKELTKIESPPRNELQAQSELVLQECWVLTESRILLKPVLGGMRIVATSISFHEQTQ